MPRRKLLKGIANTLIESFMSRNNDIDGYWGPGKLYLLSKEKGVKDVTLDLLAKKDGDDHPSIEIPTNFYREMLLRNLEKAGFDQAKVQNARITVAFETHGERKEPTFYTRGEPFLCTIDITSDLDRTYKATRVGRCAPHDPRKDLKRWR